LWDREFAVDAKGAFLCCQGAIRQMMPRRGGRIVNVSSIAGVIVRTGQIGYCSAKAAVVHFSRCLAVEMAPHGITVNCLCPGMTRTEMLEQGARERGLSLDDMVALIPAGRMAVPEDHWSSGVGGWRPEPVSAAGEAEVSRDFTGGLERAGPRIDCHLVLDGFS
jgi:NAD(P)-dependent dehydrogenase (short-subunit alcohol dehydrogenase family)